MDLNISVKHLFQVMIYSASLPCPMH
jgi:hypothetical protein